MLLQRIIIQLKIILIRTRGRVYLYVFILQWVVNEAFLCVKSVRHLWESSMKAGRESLRNGNSKDRYPPGSLFHGKWKFMQAQFGVTSSCRGCVARQREDYRTSRPSGFMYTAGQVRRHRFMKIPILSFMYSPVLARIFTKVEQHRRSYVTLQV